MNTRRTVALCGILSATGWASLAWISHGLPDWAIGFLSAITFDQFPEAVAECAFGFGYEIENGDTPTSAYLVVHFLLFGLAILPAIAIARGVVENDRFLVVIILVFGAVFRAILIPSTPIHENDFYRYLWDGKSLGHGVNPYLFAPADVTAKADPVGALFSDPLAERQDFDHLEPGQLSALNDLVELRARNTVIHRRIGHPHIPTIYPPASQASFWVSDHLTGGSVIGWKCFVVVFDLGICVVIVLLLSAVGKNPSMVIVYAWCPLVLKEWANSGHHDPIPLFFTLLAILLAVRRRLLSSTVALSVATLGKFFPVAILPVLSPPSTHASPWLRYLLFGSIIAIAYLPFLVWQNAGFAGVFSGLHAYNESWEFFSGIFALVHRSVLAFFPAATLYPAKMITGLLFATVAATVTFSAPKDESGLTLVRKCFIVFAALFLLNSSSFPWYFGWVIPFLCVFPHPAWIALSGLLPLSYLSFHPASDIPLGSAYWLGFPALSGIIWGGFLVALATSYAFSFHRRLP